MAKKKDLSAHGRKTIIELRNKGKKATEIQAESFPGFDYYEILKVVRKDGRTTALGTIKKITNRCKRISGRLNTERRAEIAQEIEKLSKDLYGMLKTTSEQLDQVTEIHRQMRKVLD